MRHVLGNTLLLRLPAMFLLGLIEATTAKDSPATLATLRWYSRRTNDLAEKASVDSG